MPIARPTALVVHGALGSAAQMQPVVDALIASSRFAQVVSVELPGHGRTPGGDEAFDMTLFADTLRATVARTNGGRPIVFGYSMGGYIALLLEAQSPGTLGGIVTLGTMLRWTPEIAAHAAGRLDPAVLRAKVPAFATLLETRHAEAGGWERVLAQTVSLLRQLGADAPLTDRTLSNISCPVHLLVGTRDDTLTFEETAHAASIMPNARASQLADVPHPIERVPVELVLHAMCRLTDSTIED